MSKSSKLVFFGTEDFSVPTLQTLIDQGWPVLAVVTKPDSRGGRGQKTIVPKVKQIAAASGIEVVSAVSHELRSPLAAVKGYTSVLLHRWDQLQDDQKQMMLEQIRHDAGRVTRLLRSDAFAFPTAVAVSGAIAFIGFLSGPV